MMPFERFSFAQIFDSFVFIPRNAHNTHVAHLQRSFVDKSRLIPDLPSITKCIRSVHRGKYLLCLCVRVWKGQPTCSLGEPRGRK